MKIDAYRIHNLGAVAGSTAEIWHSLANVGNALPGFNYPELTRRFGVMESAYKEFSAQLNKIITLELEAAKK